MSHTSPAVLVPVMNLIFLSDLLTMGLMAPALIGVWPFKWIEIHPGVLIKHPHATPPQAAEEGTTLPRQQ